MKAFRLVGLAAGISFALMGLLTLPIDARSGAVFILFGVMVTCTFWGITR